MVKRLASAFVFIFVFTQIIAPLSAVAQTKAAVMQDLSYGDDSGAPREESSIYKEAEASSPLDRKISIRMAQPVPIATFLQSISAQSKINFIMSEEFAGKKVSASLSNVTVREALDTLLRVQGLAYQRVGKSESYVITRRSPEAPNVLTKVYTLNYVSLQGQNTAAQNLSSLMPQDVTSSAISGPTSPFDTGMSGMGGTTGIGSGPSGGTNTGKGATSNSSAVLDIIKSVLTANGKIAIDGRTNKVIITDVAEVFPQVENILAELDIKAPQILIEAQIVEVSKSSGFDVGFNWGNDKGQMGSFTGGSTEVPWTWLSRPLGNGGVFKWFGFQGEPTDNEDLVAPTLDFSMFQVLFTAIMTSGEGRSLGKPKVITINNVPAVITSSREAAVSTITRSDSSGAGNLQTQGVERRRIGLTLTVTPQVNKEGYVSLTVAPSYSDLVPASDPANGFDTVTRAVSTQVRVRSGQTVVLGGLLQSTEKESTRKVPLLGQIPILGWLFTSKNKTKATTDLIIFLTPTVLSE